MDNTARQSLKILCPGCQQKLDVTAVPAFSAIHCPVCNQKLTVPKPFANFLLEEIIGTGPGATVYRGHDLTLDREIAVRIVSEHLCKSGDVVPVFLAQARKIAALVNPNILPIYACGEWQGQPYLTMQFMPNFSLAKNWGTVERPAEMDFCIETMAGITAALDAAWQGGMLHHNLTPQNILFDDDMNVKTADFGLAYAGWNPSASPADNLRATVATTLYVSPEKGLTGKQDARGDIYSLGAIFYQLVTGRPPCSEAFSSEEFGRRVAEQVQPPKSIRADTPDALNALIMQMLAVSPEVRPQTYRAILDVLEALRRGGKQKKMLSRRRKPGFRPTAIAYTNTGDLGPAVRPGPALTVKRPGSPLFALVVFLCMAAIVLMIIVAGMRRAAWYVQYIEPITTPVVKWFNPHAGRPPADGGDAALPAAATMDLAMDVSTLDNDPVPAAPGPQETSPDHSKSAPVAASRPIAPAKPVAVRPVPPKLDASHRADRPRPGDLDFFRLTAALKAYVHDLPAEHVQLEKERIRELSTLRGYLIKLMKFVPYDDDKRGVLMKSGSVLRGSVLGNEKEVIIHPRGSKYKKVKWEELAFQQYINFFDFYMSMRMNRANPTVQPGEQDPTRQEAAQDAYRLALLCDWYDKTADATRYARNAAEWDPSLRTRLNEMLPGALPGK